MMSLIDDKGIRITNSHGNEIFIIDSLGNVGIGCQTPTTTFSNCWFLSDSDIGIDIFRNIIKEIIEHD